MKNKNKPGQGRKKKEDPRTKNLNIRINDKEYNYFEETRKMLVLSQADFIQFLLDFYNA